MTDSQAHLEYENGSIIETKDSFALVPFYPPSEGNTSLSRFSRLEQEEIYALTRFMAEIEGRLQGFRTPNITPQELAEQTLFLFRELLLREVGTFNLEDGVEKFFRKLWGGEVLEKLFTDIYKQAQVISNKQDYEGDSLFSHSSRLRSEIDLFLGWYLRRKVSLLSLDREIVEEDLGEKMFALKIFHDRTWCGTKGFEVSCGLRLLGRAGITLWYKIFLLHQGRYVLVKDGWNSWIDRTDFIYMPEAQDREPFCSLVPLFPETQRMVVDEVRAFIPYSAIDLSSGRKEIEIEAGIYDPEGECILGSSQLEIIAVGGGTTKNNMTVFSPQALGIWPRDFVRGDRIYRIRCNVDYFEDSYMKEESIKVVLDFDLYEHAREKIYLAVFGIDEEGKRIQSLMPSFSSELGHFSHKIVLFPQHCVEHYIGFQFTIPKRALQIKNGTEEIYFEITLLAEDERVLCGMLEPVNMKDAPHSAHIVQQLVKEDSRHNTSKKNSRAGSFFARLFGG